MLSTIFRQVVRASIWRHKRKGKLFLSDTTLRNGEQMPGVRLRPEEKVVIARALAKAGIHSIDAGFPAAAREEIDAIQRIVKDLLPPGKAFLGPVINAHCRTLKSDIDAAVEALYHARFFKRAVTLFVGISPTHREHKHRKSKAEIVKMAVDAIQYARQHFLIVNFGPEDASRTEPEFLHEIYREAIDAGATTIGFADTVGFLTPRKAADMIKGIQDSVPNISDALLGVHFHNDLGFATANALACVQEGVNIVQGTINGTGERAGNTPLEEVVMALALHPDEYQVHCSVKPSHLFELSQLVARLTGYQPSPNKAVVGRNMFLTQSGVHQDGLLKDPASYLPFLPEQIGAPPPRLVLGKHSGRRAVRHRMEEIGKHLSDEEVQRVVERLKTGATKSMYDSVAEIHELYAEIFHDEPDAVAQPELAVHQPAVTRRGDPIA